MVFKNPKLLILNYYESLINQIDLSTEEELDRFAKNDQLLQLDKLENQPISNFQDKTLVYSNNDDNTKIYSISCEKCTKEIDNYKDPYLDVNNEIIIEEFPFAPLANLTLSDYLNSVRQEMLIELNRCQSENLEHYETIRNNLNGLDDELVRKSVFETKFCFIHRFNEIVITPLTHNMPILESNPSPFKMYLFVVDFYLSQQELEILRHLIFWSQSRQFPNERITLDSKLLRVYLLANYVCSLFKSGKYFIQVIRVGKQQLEKLRRIFFVYEPIFIELVKLDDLDDGELSFVKSFEINLWRLYYSDRFLVKFDNLASMSELEYLKLGYVKFTNRDPFRGLKNLRKLVLVGCHFENTRCNPFKCLKNLECLENHSPRSSSHISYQNLLRLKVLILTDYDPLDFGVQLSSNLIGLRFNLLYLNPENLNEMFKGLKHTHLSTVDFSNNQLPEFDAMWISELVNLKHLNISNNWIKRVNFDYEFLGGLESLRLDSNRLESVDLVFFRLNGLKSLDLSQNKQLVITSPDVFKNLVNLEELYLLDVVDESCGFKFGSSLFRRLTKLTRLGLRFNEKTNMCINIQSLDEVFLLQGKLTKEKNSSFLVCES